MSETTSTPVGHEAYAFACMRCGYGWEQAYDIEHHTDATGHEFVVYRADGRRVPSPLTKPTCVDCGGHTVRIMRAGQVSSVLDVVEQLEHRPGVTGRAAAPIATAGPIGQELAARPPAAEATRHTPGAAPEAPGAPGAAPGATEAPEAPESAPDPGAHRRHFSDLLHPFHRR
ncbi:hypothetical protein [Streptomyces sp. NPDC047928]|uniref:hypothetical protein n=1 Tax=unclassified Streptomyces TaxID=2593676 RepID=UPI00371421B9